MGIHTQDYHLFLNKNVIAKFMVLDTINSGDTMDNGNIAVMYVDEVKGIEFDKVFVVGNKMTQNEKYIAYTRALSELILVIDDNNKDYDDGSGAKSRKQTSRQVESNINVGNGTLTWSTTKNISDTGNHVQQYEKVIHS